MDIEYGTIDHEGHWVQAGTSPAESSDFPNSVNIEGADYDTLKDKHTPNVVDSDPADPNYVKVVLSIGAVWVEKTYFAAKRGAYEIVQAGKSPALDGDIV